jgi:hypothetical protein
VDRYPITGAKPPDGNGLLLISRTHARNFPPMMIRLPATLALFLSLGLATAASADCTVRYKAKQDNPLQLQAGEVTLPDAACASESAAAAALQPILAGQGWTLLAITAIIPSN